MSAAEPFQRAHAAALRLLAYRQRTESEVRRRLARRYPQSLVDQVIGALMEQRLLDDAQFARQWTESRDSRKPRSARAVKMELLARGVDGDTADDAVRTIDDDESAYRAGLARSARMNVTDLDTFRRRLRDYLRRRGFTDSVSRRAIDKVWVERDDTR